MNSSNARLILISAIWAIFFVFGLQLAGIGPLISAFATRVGVSVETVGTLFTVQSIAALASAACIGPLLERFNIRPVILIGVISVSAGVFGLSQASTFPALLISAAFLGFGVGFIDVGGQLLTIAIYGDNSARPLNLLHFLFSIGAVIGPFLAVQYGIAMFGAALVILLVALPLFYWTLPRDLQTGGDAAENAKSVSLYRSPVLWLFAMLFLLYVGLEIGIGSWTTEYMANSASVDRASGGYTTSLYWFSFMLSRLVVTAMGSRITFERQLTLGIGLALVGCVIYILTVGSTIGTVASTVILGFAFGPIYPAAFAIVARTFRHAAGRAAGLMGVAGSIGAMSIVPLQGVLLERAGGSTMTIYVAVLCALMMACYLYAARDARKYERVAVSVP